ncbi:MAG TPA: hypothetical protein VIC63_01855 [Candidatus Limnocylindria bacterium]|jgi:hypothetical protein
MTHPRRRHAALLVLALGLIACTAQPTTPPQEGACQQLAQLEVHLDEFLALDPASADSSDYQFAWDAVQEDYVVLQDYLGQVAYDRMNDLDAAVDALDEAVSELPEDASPEDLAGAIEDELTEVRAAFSALNDSLGCDE